MTSTHSKTILITGASDGIGLEAARALKSKGHQVVLIGRSEKKTQAAAQALSAPYDLADFADLSQVAALAKRIQDSYPKIDVLCHNAGGIFGKRERAADGFQMTFQVNHLAPFLLTQLLLDRLIQSRASLIFTASIAHKIGSWYHKEDPEKAALSFLAYGNSKLMNIMTALELHRRYHDRGLHTASYHPGVVASNFASASASPVRLMYLAPMKKLLRMVSPAEGADTMIWLADGDPKKDWQSGGYYVKRRLTAPSRAARSKDLARRLWDDSMKMIGPFLKGDR